MTSKQIKKSKKYIHDNFFDYIGESILKLTNDINQICINYDSVKYDNDDGIKECLNDSVMYKKPIYLSNNIKKFNKNLYSKNKKWGGGFLQKSLLKKLKNQNNCISSYETVKFGEYKLYKISIHKENTLEENNKLTFIYVNKFTSF